MPEQYPAAAIYKFCQVLRGDDQGTEKHNSQNLARSQLRVEVISRVYSPLHIFWRQLVVST